jgi:hypothetical protein
MGRSQAHPAAAQGRLHRTPLDEVCEEDRREKAEAEVSDRRRNGLRRRTGAWRKRVISLI